jgi:hypothetical protein
VASAPTSAHVTFHASGALADPEFVLESHSYPDGPNVVEQDTRLDLLGGRVVLFFRGAKFVPFLAEDDWKFFYSLSYFLTYRSRVQYNITVPEGLQLPEIAPSSQVSFAVQRLVRVETEEQIAGRQARRVHHDTTPSAITVDMSEIEDLLRVSTRQLHLAIIYFMIGCEQTRYFFVEFYKAIEAIETAFGRRRAATATVAALAPHGLEAHRLGRFKQIANDRSRPFDIGRHAPFAGADIRTIDLRRLLTEDESRGAFTDAVIATRQVIDSYFLYLRAQRPR